MTTWQHRDVARGRWHGLSLADQFGNIGSEISRAIHWSTKNPETAQAALYRGLELFDLMLDDPRHRRSVARLREIARAREVVVDFLAGSNEYGSTGASLQKYFDHFAVAARRAHVTGPDLGNSGLPTRSAAKVTTSGEVEGDVLGYGPWFKPRKSSSP